MASGAVGLLALAATPAPASGPLTTGNGHFRSGDLAAALAAYGEPEAGAADHRLRLARATALVASANASDPAAATSLQRAEDDLRALAAAPSGDVQLLRAANANLGALLLGRAEAAVATDRPLAAGLFREAATAYLAASRLDGADLDAARNVEHARRRAAEVLQSLQENPPTPQERQNQQQRDSQQGQQQQDHDQSAAQDAGENADQEQSDQQQQDARQLADQLDELSQRQQQEAEQSAANRQEAGAPDQQRAISDQTQEQLEQLESQIESLAQQRQASQEAADESTAPQGRQSPSPRDSLDEARQSLQQARDAQERAEQALRQSDPSEAAEAQQQAADQLSRAAAQARQAAEQLQEQAEQQGTQPQSGAEEAPPAAPQPTSQNSQSEQIGDPLVERLLDRERRQREQRAVSRPGRQIRVERDW